MINSNFYSIKDIRIEGFNYGIYGDTAVLNKIQDFYVGGCNVGVSFNNGSYMTTLTKGTIRSCTQKGFEEKDSRIIIDKVDIEAIGKQPDNTYAGIAISTGSSTELKNMHIETSGTAIQIASGGNVITDNIYIGGCSNGVKQLDATARNGIFEFNDVRFAGVTNHFDIPNVTFYIIHPNCTFKDNVGNNVTPVINANATSGVYQSLTYRTGNPYLLDLKNGVYGVKGNEVIYKGQPTISNPINFGSVNGQSTVKMEVTAPSTVDFYSQRILVTFSNYSIPDNIIFDAFIKAGTTNIIVVRCINIGTTAVNIGSITPKLTVINY